MRKSEFETKLLDRIAFKKLTLLSEPDNRNCSIPPKCTNPRISKRFICLN